MNPDGTEPRRLAAGGSPSWGQDPTCVYYQSRVDRTFNSISIVDWDAQPTQIMPCSFPEPSVSLHNRRVVYLEGGYVRVKDLDSQGLVAEWPCTVGIPRLSPRGDELCLKIYGVRNTTGLWIFPLDGREPVKVLGGQINIFAASWASDGTKLAFWVGPPHFEIWSADLDPKVSTIGAPAPGQTREEDLRYMVRLCTRRIETDPLDAQAYSDRARCYDRLRELVKGKEGQE